MSRETLPPESILRLTPAGLRFPTTYAWGFVDIDPPMAAALLERAPFAPVEDAFSAAYAAWMAVDGWRVTGDSIGLDTEGHMQDGVARCLACIASGRPFRTLVTTGLEPGIRPVLDLRTPNRRPAHPDAEWGGGALSLVGATVGAMPFALALASPEARLASAAGILASVAAAEGIPARGGLNPDALAAIHYLASAEDPARADAFLDAMALPQLEPGSPPQALVSSLDALEGFDEGHVLRVLAVAWRAYMRGSSFEGAAAKAPDGAAVLADLAALRLRSLPGPTRAPRLADPTVAFESVDPRRAAAWLASLGPSRGGGEACPAFAEDLLSCRWRRTGHTLKADDSEGLLDGTRRLRAVLASNRPIKGLVARGVDRAASAFLDHGRRGRLSMHDPVHARDEADETLEGLRALQRARTAPVPTGQPDRARKLAVNESVAAARRGRGPARTWKADLPSLFDVANPALPSLGHGRGQR